MVINPNAIPPIPSSMPIVHHQEKWKKAIFTCWLRMIGFSVALFNFFMTYKDLSDEQDTTNWKTLGYECIIVLNLVLAIGILCGHQILIGFWIFIYGALLIACCTQSVVQGYFQWMPGISLSSATLFTEAFDLPDSRKPIVAISLALCSLLIVFFTFITNARERFKKYNSANRTMTFSPGTPQCLRHPGLFGHSFVFYPTLREQRPGGEMRVTAPPVDDNPPAYSEVDTETTSNSSSVPPPTFEEAINVCSIGDSWAKTNQAGDVEAAKVT